MIIVLSGKARSGKDTAAGLLYKIFEDKGETCKLIAYADYLKEILGKCLGLTNDQLYGDLKEEYICDLPIRTSSGNITDNLWTPRKLMQYLGTDIFRKVNPECWINVVKDLVLGNDYYDNYVITDARFNNEIDWVVNSGGVRIHLERKNKDFCDNDGHPSEHSLSRFRHGKNSFAVDNSFDVGHLQQVLHNIIGDTHA